MNAMCDRCGKSAATVFVGRNLNLCNPCSEIWLAMSPKPPGRSCDGDPSCEVCDVCKAEASREHAHAIAFVERDPAPGDEK